MLGHQVWEVLRVVKVNTSVNYKVKKEKDCCVCSQRTECGEGKEKGDEEWRMIIVTKGPIESVFLCISMKCDMSVSSVFRGFVNLVNCFVKQGQDINIVGHCTKRLLFNSF